MERPPASTQSHLAHQLEPDGISDAISLVPPFASVAGLFLAVVVSGCATVTRHGDANLRDNKNIVWVMNDALVFPNIPLTRTTTYRYRVRDLPQVIHPHGFYLEVPADEATDLRDDQPWRRCKIRASLSTPDGATFFARTLDLSRDWTGASGSGRNSRHRSLFLFFAPDPDDHDSHLPEHFSYDFEVQILRPSLRSIDALRVYAPTYLMNRRPATSNR
jgi:hypothetical protein